MKAQKAPLRKLPVKFAQSLLKKLDEAMTASDYHEVDELLTKYPDLIHNLTPKCEVPLVMAIKHWKPQLVSICIKHGADPDEEHLCSKDKSKPKRPKLIATQELVKRIRTDLIAWDTNNEIYCQIIQAMEIVAPCKKSGKS